MQKLWIFRAQKYWGNPKRLLFCAWKFFGSGNFKFNSAFVVFAFQKTRVKIEIFVVITECLQCGKTLWAAFR
jgi:hypothetical protein